MRGFAASPVIDHRRGERPDVRTLASKPEFGKARTKRHARSARDKRQLAIKPDRRRLVGRLEKLRRTRLHELRGPMVRQIRSLQCSRTTRSRRQSAPIFDDSQDDPHPLDLDDGLAVRVIVAMGVRRGNDEVCAVPIFSHFELHGRVGP